MSRWDGPLQIDLLGPVTARGGRGSTDLGGRQQRLLLSLLAVALPKTLNPDLVAEALWPSSPSSANALRVVVSRVRQALAGVLEDPNLARELVLRTSAGLRLNVAPEAIDTRGVEDGLKAATQHRRDGNPREAISALDRALESWRGEPFGDLAGHPAFIVEVSRLGELRARATLLRAECHIQVGEHTAATTELEAFVAREPFHEEAARLLMTALYKLGRQSDALRAYQRIRQSLREELGLDPGPRLRALEDAILRHDVLGGGGHLGVAPERSSLGYAGLTIQPTQELRPPLSNPAGSVRVPPLSPMVGRSRELAAVLAAVSPGKMVLITGPAGIGKTRLLEEALAYFPGNQLRGAIRPEPMLAYEPFAELVAESFPLGLEEDATAEEEAELVRLRLFADVASRLELSGAIVVIDDLHWALPGTIAILSFLLERPNPPRVLASARSLDSPATKPLALALSLRGCLVAVELGPLSPEETLAIVTRAAGMELDEALGRQICELSGGSPLYAVELARHRGGGYAPLALPQPRDEDPVSAPS